MMFQSHAAPSERTLAYIIESRPLHDRLSQILTQLAGFSLLAMTPGRRLPMLDGPSALARAEFLLVRDGLALLNVPACATHHSHHVAEAANAIGRSLDLLTACLRRGADDAGRAELSRSLRVAVDHLRMATRLLPGFEMVDLRQACCAAHATTMPIACC